VSLVSWLAYLRRACEVEDTCSYRIKVSAYTASAWYPPVCQTQTHGPTAEVLCQIRVDASKGRMRGDGRLGAVIGDWLRACEGEGMAGAVSRARRSLLGRLESSRRDSSVAMDVCTRPRVSHGTAARRCAPLSRPRVEGAIPNRASGDMGRCRQVCIMRWHDRRP
jgi:hypothetical protein